MENRMANTSITVRIDEDLKKEADIFFDELGMSLTTAFNVFVKQCLREQRIPFEISTISSQPRKTKPAEMPSKIIVEAADESERL